MYGWQAAAYYFQKPHGKQTQKKATSLLSREQGNVVKKKVIVFRFSRKLLNVFIANAESYTN